MDAAQSFWRNWVIDLDSSQQGNLLGQLGLQHLGSLALILILFVGLSVMLLLLYWWWKRRPRMDQDALARAADKLLKRFQRAGEVRHGHESVSAFLQRMAQKKEGGQQARLLQAASAYEKVRYQENGNVAQAIAIFRRLRP